MSELVDAFRTAFRKHPAAVAIIAADSPEGPAGLTASSVASVSIEPLALSFSVSKTGGSAERVLKADTFVVHLLGDDQAAVAEAFALSGAPRFTEEQGWRTLPTGEPWLADAPVALRARPLDIITVGQSRLVVAEVIDAYRGSEAGPLLYHDRQFFTLDGTPAAK